MNSGHLHLMISHLPVFGLALGILLLIYGMLRNEEKLNHAAYILLVISSVGAAVAYTTGESAEEMVENIPGITEQSIHEHEEFASVTLISAILTGCLSILALIVAIKRPAISKKAALITLIITLVSLGLCVRMAYLGGQIRHTEISAGIQKEPQPDSEDDD